MSWSANLEADGVAGGNASSRAFTLTTAPAAGDFLVVLWGSYTNSSPPTTSAGIIDNKGGNTWRLDLFANDGSNRAIAAWSTTVVNGGSSFTVTVTPNVLAYGTIMVLRYANPGTPITVESTNSSYGNSRFPTTGALAIASGPDLVVAGVIFDSSTPTMTAPLTQEIVLTIGEKGVAGDYLNATSGFTPSATLVSPYPWIMGAMAYHVPAFAPWIFNSDDQ